MAPPSTLAPAGLGWAVFPVTSSVHFLPEKGEVGWWPETRIPGRALCGPGPPRGGRQGQVGPQWLGPAPWRHGPSLSLRSRADDTACGCPSPAAALTRVVRTAPAALSILVLSPCPGAVLMTPVRAAHCRARASWLPACPLMHPACPSHQHPCPLPTRWTHASADLPVGAPAGVAAFLPCLGGPPGPLGPPSRLPTAAPTRCCPGPHHPTGCQGALTSRPPSALPLPTKRSRELAGLWQGEGPARCHCGYCRAWAPFPLPSLASSSPGRDSFAVALCPLSARSQPGPCLMTALRLP